MDEDTRKIVSLLKNIDEKLGDIRYDLKDIVKNMPKVPYYGDLLQDIAKAVGNISK